MLEQSIQTLANVAKDYADTIDYSFQVLSKFQPRLLDKDVLIKIFNFATPPEEVLKSLNVGIMPGGFPQGMPCSAFLSIFVLGDYFEQAWTDVEKKVIGYADDFLFFFKTLCKPRDFPQYGITHSEEKCG